MTKFKKASRPPKKFSHRTEPDRSHARNNSKHLISIKENGMASSATRHERTYKLSAFACALLLLISMLTF